MANVQESVGRHAAPSLLPHPPHLALALLQQVAGPRDPVVLVALQLVQRVARAALLRRHMLHAVKVGRAPQQRLQLEQPLALLVLLLLDVLQVGAQVCDVRAEVGDRLQAVVEEAKKGGRY